MKTHWPKKFNKAQAQFITLVIRVFKQQRKHHVWYKDLKTG